MKTKQAIKIIESNIVWRVAELEFGMEPDEKRIGIAIDHALECMRIVDTLNKPKFRAALHEVNGRG